MLAIVIVTMSVIASNEGDDILLHNRQFLAVALLTENGTVLRTIMLVICDSCSSPVHAEVSESDITEDYTPVRAGITEMQRICNRFPLD